MLTSELMSGRKLIIRRNLVCSIGDGFNRDSLCRRGEFASSQKASTFLLFCFILHLSMTGMFLTSCTTKTSFGVAEVGEYVKTDRYQPGRAAVLGRGLDLAVRQLRLN